MNSRQNNSYIQWEIIKKNTIDNHILLFKGKEVIRIFHSLNQVNEYLTIRGEIPEF